MKKFLATLVLLATISGLGYAGSPVLFQQTDVANGISLYFVNSTTNTNATYAVTAGSLALTTNGGLFAGTTYINLIEPHVDTLAELVAFINATSTSTVGFQGGVVAALNENNYATNLSTGLTTATTVYCLGVANKKDVAFSGDIIGMTYIINSTDRNNRIALTNLVVNNTFGAGTTTINIYDGDSTGNKIRTEKVATTAVDHQVKLPYLADFTASPGTDMRIDIISSLTNLSGAYANITYKIIK